MSIEKELSERIGERVFFGSWNSVEDLCRDFSIEADELAPYEILFAEFDLYDDYNGRAYVVFAMDCQLFSIIGWYCSRKILNGQWTPEPTSIEHVRREIDRRYRKSSEEYMAAWEALVRWEARQSRK